MLHSLDSDSRNNMIIEMIMIMTIEIKPMAMMNGKLSLSKVVATNANNLKAFSKRYISSLTVGQLNINSMRN